MLLGWLWDTLTQHFMGLLILAEVFWPFLIIGPIVRSLLAREISQDWFERKRFNRSASILTILIYITLEAEFLNLGMTAPNLVHWIAILLISILAWFHPEQIPYLSVFPETFFQPVLVKINRILARWKRYWRPKGFPVQLARGDQLMQPKVRQRIGILGETFRCFICKKQKPYPEEYGGTLFIKHRRSHLCADCVQAAPQLKVEDLRRWM